MFGITIETLVITLLILLILAFVGYLIKNIVKNAIISYHRSKAQATSIIGRYRNRATKALWEDMMDIKIAGFIPVGGKVEDWLNQMFPREMEELERQRTQNPIAWRSTMEFLFPLILSVKHFATYKGGEVIKNIIGQVTQSIDNAGNPPTNIQMPEGFVPVNQSMVEDPDQGGRGPSSPGGG